MEFLIYLSPIGNEIIDKLARAKFSFRENIGLCSNQGVYGYVEQNKRFVVCTRNIKNREYDVSSMINETVYHEAVHAAQICKSYNPLGISHHKMTLSYTKQQNLYNSLKVTNSTSNNLTFKLEREAYWLEDKPELVSYYVDKNCSNR